ncbi:DEAD/DEAH box helicase [Fructilactobacillus sanfranciscensis]|uniref:DEAD/DEAH box helicase n=1 Tax=Fructilactobacillus sanfranciscensis TaxID=1625 RepID=UPI0013D3F685|nr:helicase-related protein [Fructilactobacillus sanfranciscensis]NDR60349.1 DNA/RNA helicase [Fructilactobacillus sanfranciscensis]
MNQLDITGRLLPDTACDEMILNNHALQFQPAIQINHTTIHCTRCASDCEKAEAQLPDETYFCYQCFNLGRLDSSMKLVHLPGINQFEVVHPVLTWKGRLTELQQKCSDEVVKAFQEHQNKLLWAVTGAGKTEISFAGIAWALAQGLRVGIASPRVDVCVELYPRYQAAFANTSMILLHGKSEEPYQYRQLTICTTHQLLRFQDAFDVLIIDEVDAFPYANNDSLQMAAKRSVKKHGSLLLMTATPSPKLRQQYQVSYLPLRFHRHLLPKIKIHFCFNWKRKIYAGKIPPKVIFKVLQKIERQQRFLLFVPRIKDLQVVDEILSKKYHGEKCWKTVYSADEARMEKVQAMRDEKVLFLITTTILERGVTFPGIDVIIFGGDERVFSVASLVQIAGRVGRKASRPTGDVDCYIGSYSSNVAEARKQIAEMNRKGKALG